MDEWIKKLEDNASKYTGYSAGDLCDYNGFEGGFDYKCGEMHINITGYGELTINQLEALIKHMKKYGEQ